MTGGEQQELRPIERVASLEDDYADVWAGVATDEGVITVYATSASPGLGDAIEAAAERHPWSLRQAPATRRQLAAVRDRVYALRHRIGPFQVSLDFRRGLVVLTTGRGSDAQRLLGDAGIDGVEVRETDGEAGFFSPTPPLLPLSEREGTGDESDGPARQP